MVSKPNTVALIASLRVLGALFFPIGDYVTHGMRCTEAGHQKARSTLPLLGFLWVVYEVAAEVEQRWSSPVIRKRLRLNTAT